MVMVPFMKESDWEGGIRERWGADNVILLKLDAGNVPIYFVNILQVIHFA